MTLVMKQLVQVDISGNYLWSTNKNGEYTTANTGGWGAPNPELNQSAILCLAKRLDEFLTFVSDQVYYSETATNDFEPQFQINYPDKDGWIQIWQMRVWVSEDAIMDVSGTHVLVDGDFFYIPGQANKIFMKTGSGDDAYAQVTDYNVMINSTDDTNPYFVMCEDLFYNKLAKKYNDLYKQYTLARNPQNTEAMSDLSSQMNDIQINIVGADYSFRGGLKYQANDIIEDLIDRYNVT